MTTRPTLFFASVLWICCALLILAREEGRRCRLGRSFGTNRDERGVCRIFDDCPYALQLLRNNQRPKTCGFRGVVPIVCCTLDSSDVTPSTSPSISTKQVQNQSSDVDTSRRSAIKCEQYNPRVRAHKYVFNGRKSLAKEFPHMAALGYGEDATSADWNCGGTLISDDIVLTAAHCLYARDGRKVTWVRLGDVDLSSDTDDADPKTFRITDTFVHPAYDWNSHYNDIALLKLNATITVTDYVRPACLHSRTPLDGDGVEEVKLLVTGWGYQANSAPQSVHLLNAQVKEIELQECGRRYRGLSRLREGIKGDLQICAGHEDGSDTCRGDSGGPLQYSVIIGRIRWYVAGVTSFGKGCGESHSVGVYVRVSHYLNWIEDVAWPSN